MITALLIQALGQTETPAQILGKVFEQYLEAKTLSGSITMTQTLRGYSIRIETQCQAKSPSQFYLRQVRGGSDPATCLVTSDGKYFSYNLPAQVRMASPNKRLVETVKQRNRTLNFRDIYMIAIGSMIDRSTATDIVFARTDNLKFRRSQWVSLKMSRREGSGFLITGPFRDNSEAPPTGNFEIWVSKDYNLEKYVQRETIQLDGAAPETVTTTWNVNVTLGNPGSESLYQLVR